MSARLMTGSPLPNVLEMAEIAAEFANARHLPKRTCLGCGHTLARHGGTARPRWWYAQCGGQGVEVSGNRWDGSGHVNEVWRMSWAQVRDLTRGPVQTELFEAVPRMSGHTPWAEGGREGLLQPDAGQEAIRLLIEYDGARHRSESGFGGLQAELDVGAAHAHICIFLQRRGLA